MHREAAVVVDGNPTSARQRAADREVHVVADDYFGLRVSARSADQAERVDSDMRSDSNLMRRKKTNAFVDLAIMPDRG